MRTSYEIIEDKPALIDEWRRIYGVSSAKVFLSPAWIDALLTAAPPNVVFGCVRVFDDLRGVYGMAIVAEPQRRGFSLVNEVRLHESGIPSLDRIYVEFNDILLSKTAPDGAREAVVEEIARIAAKSDQLVFRNSAPELAAAVENVARENKFKIEVLSRQPTFEIDLGGIGESCLQFASSSLRAKIRRSIKRYEQRGAVRLRRAESDAEKAIAWTELMRLHSETWSQRGKKGVFDNPEFSRFHEGLMECGDKSIDLLRLTAGQETIGVLYNLVAGDRAYNYQSGFRYEADNQLAPGFVSHALAADYYRETGFAVYDLMGGDAEYKRRLGKMGVMLSSLVMTRPGLRSSLRATFKAARISHE